MLPRDEVRAKVRFVEPAGKTNMLAIYKQKTLFKFIPSLPTLGYKSQL